MILDRFIPRSLAARTVLLLLAGLAVVQIAGLTIHALDRIDLQRLAQMRDVAARAIGLYRGIALTAPEARQAAVRELDATEHLRILLEPQPPIDPLPLADPAVERQIRAEMEQVPMPARDRPRDIAMLGGPDQNRIVIGLRLPEGQWLNVSLPLPPPRPWHSSSFLIDFLLMTAAAGLLSLWAVRRLIRPVATLAAAADALGRDVNAPPLPEDGPTEIATSAAAFNTMASRIRRFVQDRTFLLTAIGHDLRTPITRLRLRAEFVEDETQRRRMLADLDELEAMVAATLEFGRDAASAEPLSSVDLPELARTVLDEQADARPDHADKLTYAGPNQLPVPVRPVSMKRALTNLVSNAVAYGGAARLTLSPHWSISDGPSVTLTVDDDGPGIPPTELEQVFQPFHRVEASRNRATGGMGLGLPIARNILRAHGGDVTLENRPEGGARATVILPT